MDIYEYLKLDHEQVSHLFKQFEKSEDLERRKQIVEFIILELIAHARSEEDTFYKALKPFDKSYEDAKHGEREHKEIEAQISLIVGSKEFGANWVKKVEKLKELVDHHVSDEEGPLFRHAKKVLSDDDANTLKEQMHYVKQKILQDLKKSEKITIEM